MDRDAGAAIPLLALVGQGERPGGISVLIRGHLRSWRKRGPPGQAIERPVEWAIPPAVPSPHTPVDANAGCH